MELSRRFLISVLVAGAVSTAFAFHAAPALAQGRAPLAPSLAREKIAPATAAAKKWERDAILIQVAATNIGDDGRSVAWDYTFYSAGAKKCAVINVSSATEILPRESGGPQCQSPEIKDFMESDRAAKIARANGVTRPAINMAVGVSATPKGEKTVWIVADAGGVPGDVTVVIDSQSGEVFSKSTQRGIPRRYCSPCGVHTSGWLLDLLIYG